MNYNKNKTRVEQLFNAEELNRQTFFLKSILYLIFSLSGIYFITRLFQNNTTLILSIVLVIINLFSIILILLLKKGFLKVSSNITIIILWLSFAFLAFMFGGIYDGAIMAITFVIMISSILLKKISTLIISILSLAYFWFLYYVMANGLKEFQTISPIMTVRDITVIFLGFISVFLFYQRSVRKSLTQIANLLYQKEIDSEKIISTEKSYREIFNSVDDGIFVHDANNGKIIDVNQSACFMFGYTKDELLNKDVEVLSACEEGYTRENAIKKISQSANNPLKFEWRSKRSDNSIFWSEIQLSHSHILGEKRILAVVRDISTRKSIEAELTMARDLAENSSKLKTSFLQNMSHEIRTPMNAITGFACLLSEPDISQEKLNNYTNIINASSAQLLSIVEDILTVSRIETGQETINEKPINI
jgi:PAS domain S-box-containing protein